MAKGKKKRGRRQSFVSKLLNGFGLAIFFARPIEILIRNIGSPEKILGKIIAGLTFGLSEGPLDLAVGTKMYVPMGASAVYGMTKSFIVRKFPIR